MLSKTCERFRIDAHTLRKPRLDVMSCAEKRKREPFSRAEHHENGVLIALNTIPRMVRKAGTIERRKELNDPTTELERAFFVGVKRPPSHHRGLELALQTADGCRTTVLKDPPRIIED